MSIVVGAVRYRALACDLGAGVGWCALASPGSEVYPVSSTPSD